MTTASALATRCDQRFRGNNNSVVGVTEWLSYLNEAYNRVNRYSSFWPWLETAEQTVTVPDSGTVGAVNNRSAALPADVLTLNWAYDVTDDYRLIDQMGHGDFFHQDHLRSEVGQPVTYRVRNGTIELNPTPSAATQVAFEAVLLPSALAADTFNTVESSGGVAGNITATGISVGDTLIAVGGVKTSDQSYTDFSSQFAIVSANTINNSGGAATTGYKLVVVWRSANSSASPAFPSQWHDILVEAALMAAYLDDGNTEESNVHESLFNARLKEMSDMYLGSRTETYQPIRDTFWS